MVVNTEKCEVVNQQMVDSKFCTLCMCVLNNIYGIANIILLVLILYCVNFC